MVAWVRRFHLLKPEYIHHRIKQLQRSFRLRVILCHVDVDDVVECLAQVRLGIARSHPHLKVPKFCTLCNGTSRKAEVRGGRKG